MTLFASIAGISTGASLLIAIAVVVWLAIDFFAWCALVDGARRRRYQDRVAEEWLERKDEVRAA